MVGTFTTVEEKITPAVYPRVAVLVVNWNGWRDTLTCLRSLHKLNYPNYVTLVIDNGSSDGSLERIREAFPDVLVLEAGRNLGFAGGNNLGIRRAVEIGADYVWVLNNDTVVDPQSLSAMVRAAEADPKCAAIGSVIYRIDGSRVEAWGGGDVNLHTGHSWHARGPQSSLTYLTGSSLLLRKQALRQVGLFDERFFLYWEDTDLSFRLRKAGWNLHVAPEAKVWHKESGTAGQHSYLKARYFHRGLVLFMRRHATRPVVPAAIALYQKTKSAVVMRRWRVLAGIWIGWLEGWLARS